MKKAFNLVVLSGVQKDAINKYYNVVLTVSTAVSNVKV